VKRLYNTIVNNPRHTDGELVSFESAEGPLFIDWRMRFVDLEKLPESVLDLFIRKYSFKDGVGSVSSDKLGRFSC